MALSKELKKLAKKHGIVLERGMTDEEVQPLVDAAEAAAKASAEEAKDNVAAPEPAPIGKPVNENNESENNHSHPILISEIKRGEKHFKLFQQGKVAFIQLNATVIAEFPNVEAGVKHLENLQRV